MGVSDGNNRKRRRNLWKAAGPDMIPPKLCPKAISQYPLIRNTRQNPLVDDVRSHLCYLGWKIEHLSYRGLFRYTSPDGNLYISLRQVCHDLISSSNGEISSEISSQDEEKKPLLASQGNEIASSESSPDDDNDQQVSGSSSDETDSHSETEYYPEAVVYWYKHGLDKKRKCHLDMILKARKHLFALGWLCTSVNRRNTGAKMLRYTSPRGKNCNSLRTACKLCMDEGGLRETTASSQDEENKPLLASQGNEIASSESSPGDDDDDDQQVSGSSSDETDSASETEYYPEAVVYWYKHGLEKNRKCHLDMKLKARKHLFALGWLCTPVNRGNTGAKMLRYTSPSGKNCNSLRTACKLCMDEGGLRETMASTKNSFSSSESSILSRSRKRRKKIEANSHSVEDEDEEEEEHHEDKRCRKVTEIAKNKINVKNKSNDQKKPTQSSPVLRSSKAARPEVQDPGSLNLNPRTVLSWLIDNNVVMEREKVQYRGSEAHSSSLKKGRIGRDGIKCDCCIKVFTLGGFEVHAGSKEKRPSANIILEDGRSLLECQRQVLRDIKARSSDRKVKNDEGYSLQGGDDQSDDICSVCHHGGDIILCDKCPSSFHHSCLGLKDVPEGEWVCPSCCCGICGQRKFEDTEYSTDNDMVRICDQCEHKFHMECIKKSTGVVKLKDYSKNKWFCSDKCENVYSSLTELLGRSFPLGVDNLTWTLLKSMEEEEEHQDPNDDSSENEALVQNQSKLNVALELMHECFEPVREVLTGKDLVEDVIFNCRSNLNRLNFRGFYTMLLEKNEEIISVAIIRVYEKVAELPLIATRLQYRRHGMCSLFLNEIEKKLIELGVERLTLPAVPALVETWTTKFGFSEMTDNERLQFLDYTFLDFPDTTMCHKLLAKTPSTKFSVGVHRSKYHLQH
ncbi:hypothetical protein Q3G72_019884 [Acer saccharum]|nr:hypothetical protein Q3G72_019884 [Acer saccharum]